MDWWEATVRVRVGNTWGSGVFVAPRVVLTAAHVVSAGQGFQPYGVDALRVTPMFGATLHVGVVTARVAKPWSDGAVGASLHDLAVLAVDTSIGVHVNPRIGYGTVGAPFEGAAYGFVGDQSVVGRYLEGALTSDGWAYESSSIVLEPGMSGGPVLAKVDPNDPTVLGLVGVNRSTGTGMTNIGLVLRADVFPQLLQSLNDA